MTTHLRHDLDLLHTALLSGKLPRNLSWADTIELIGQIGEVQPHGSDEFAFLVGTQRAFFKRPHTHDLGVEEVARLRKFLREAGPAVTPVETSQPCRMVVVIDHHVAHVYQDHADQDHDQKVPESEATVHPYDPFHFHHHLIHKKEAHYKGERVPEDKTFYEEVAKDLLPAVEIVLIGHGDGNSSALNHLTEYLKANHHDLSKRVIATETVDLSALTLPEIEAIAKQHMISVI